MLLSTTCPRKNPTRAKWSISSKGRPVFACQFLATFGRKLFARELVSEAVQGLGGLDIVVSNAGRQQTHESIADISTDQFDWTMKTNIYAPFWIFKAALPHLPPGSVIIATTSVQAYDPSADLYDYALTKAATMNSSSRSRNSWVQRAFASMEWPRANLDGPAGERWGSTKSSRNSERPQRWDVQANLRN